MNAYTKALTDLEARNNEAKAYWNPAVQSLHNTWQYSELLDKLFHIWSLASKLDEESDFENEFLRNKVSESLADYEGTKAAIEALTDTSPVNYQLISATYKSGPAFEKPVHVDWSGESYENNTHPSY